MKKINVSDATGRALDWLVAKLDGRNVIYDGISYWVVDDRGSKPIGSSWKQAGSPCGYSPSTFCGDGGPIIDDALISTGPIFVDGEFDCWEAFDPNLEYDDNGEGIPNSDSHMYGPTRLIAGLRCWIVRKVGYEVEVPEELLK